MSRIHDLVNELLVLLKTATPEQIERLDAFGVIPPLAPPRFDKTAYQREYMRRYRAKVKAK